MSTKKAALLTTSREPTDKIRIFCSDLVHSIPNVVRVNRGKLSLDGIAEKTIELGADHVLVVDRWKDGFAYMRFFRIDTSGLTPFPLQINVANARLHREFEAKTKRIKSLAITISSESSSLAKKVAQSMGDFFNVPILKTQKNMADYSVVMRVSGNGLLRITFVLLPELVEIGPRMDVSRVGWDNK